MKRKALSQRQEKDSPSAKDENPENSPVLSSSSPSSPMAQHSTPTISRKEVTALRKKARTDEIERKIKNLVESKKSIETGGKVLVDTTNGYYCCYLYIKKMQICSSSTFRI